MTTGDKLEMAINTEVMMGNTIYYITLNSIDFYTLFSGHGTEFYFMGHLVKLGQSLACDLCKINTNKGDMLYDLRQFDVSASTTSIVGAYGSALQNNYTYAIPPTEIYVTDPSEYSWGWSPPEVKCECGSEAVGSNIHSEWCPKKE